MIFLIIILQFLSLFSVLPGLVKELTAVTDELRTAWLTAGLPEDTDDPPQPSSAEMVQFSFRIII